MSAATPLTAGSEIAISNVSSRQPAQKDEQESVRAQFGEFNQDIVNISKLARDKQQQSELAAQQEIKQIATDVIRVTSTIGQSKAAGNLSETQASKLYKEIAALL